MKLSEAMRKGIALRPQAFGQYFDANEAGYISGSCGVGAILEGCYGDYISAKGAIRSGDYMTHLPDLKRRLNTVKLPDVADAYKLSVADTIWQALVIMNDDLHMTREQQADWLEAQEL